MASGIDRGAWRELQFNVFNRFVNMSSIPKYARALPLILALGPVAIPAFQAAKTTAPIDPQKVQDQQDMTWADYHPIPGVSWSDPSLKPSKKQFKVALIAVDFDDQPFVVTLPKHSDLFGNPQIDPVPRDQVPQFYADFYNTPSAINHRQTINGYWMEQSRGQIGIGKIDTFGPYRMPKKLFQYGLNEYGQKVARSYRIRSRWPPGARCRRAVARGGRRHQIEVRHRDSDLRGLRRDQRVAGVWRDEVPEQGLDSRQVGQSRPNQAALGADSIRTVDQLESRPDALGTLVRTARREFRDHHARDRPLRFPRGG